MTTVRPFYLLIGKATAGKDTAARLMSDATGLRVGECSWAIYGVLGNSLGRAGSKLNPQGLAYLLTKALLCIPKEEIRPYLIEVGNYFFEKDPLCWVRPSVDAGAEILTGIRRRAELEAAKEYLASEGYRVTTIWITRSGLPDIPDNLELTEADADLVVDMGYRNERFWEAPAAQIEKQPTQG